MKTDTKEDTAATHLNRSSDSSLSTADDAYDIQSTKITL